METGFLNEVFRGFFQSLQMFGQYFKSDHNRFLHTHFPTHSLIILLKHAAQSQLLAGSLKNSHRSKSKVVALNLSRGHDNVWESGGIGSPLISTLDGNQWSASQNSFLGWGETDVSPLGTSATNWPIVPVLDNRRL
jgi:hypothetical protein